MAKVTDLTTLAKTSVENTDYLLVSSSTTGGSKRLTVASLFPAVSTAGAGSETLYNSATLTNKNQIVFKGLKSDTTSNLTVATTSSNLVLSLVEAGIDLNECDNTTASFMTGVDFTKTVTSQCPVVNGGTGLSTIAKGAMLYASATDTIAATSAMSTNGQLLIGNASTGIPTLATLTAGSNVTIDNSTPGAISIAAAITSLSAILDMGNYNIDLGTGYISADGSTSQGVRVTGANTYLGASGSYFNNDILNIGGGGIEFSDAATVNPTTQTGGTAGKDLTIQSGNSASAAAGALNLTAGTASGSGAGGNITLTAGRDTSGSSDGAIVMKTYTGGTATAAITIAPEGQDVTVNTGDVIMSTGNIYMRNSSNPDVIKYQGSPGNLDDDDADDPLAADVLTGIVTCTPTADRTKETDTASNYISGLSLNADGDAFDFSFINLATDGTSHITLTAHASGVTVVGCMVISAQDLAEDAFTSGTSRFRIRRTGSSAVSIYRIA